jgi:hypothetical protein
VPIENEAIALLDQLRWSDFPRSIARKLQAYSVNIYRHEFNQLLKEGRITIEQDRFPVLVDPLANYDKETGLKIQEVASGEALFYDS